MLTTPLTDIDLALAVEAVAGSVAVGGSLTSRQTEHRLQSSIGVSPPPTLGLPSWPGSIPDTAPRSSRFHRFLGCDPAGNLHDCRETKVGHDPKVVLQALDYGIWVLANQQSVRTHRPDWPRPAAPQSRVYLDFVLAAGDQSTAVSGYLAGQLEVLTDDIDWLSSSCRISTLTPSSSPRCPQRRSGLSKPASRASQSDPVEEQPWPDPGRAREQDARGQRLDEHQS